MAFCPNCGSQVEAGKPFCPQCGAPLGAQQSYYGAQQPYYGTRGAGQPVSFGQKNIAVAIILSIVTCGIYGIIWFINVVNQLNEASGDQNATPGGTVFLLGLVTCGIYMIYWFYKAGEQVNAAKTSRGLPADSSNGVLYLVLALFTTAIIPTALIQNELNKIAALYGAPPA